MTLHSSLPALTLLSQQCHKQRTAQKGPKCTPHKSLTQKKQQLHNGDLGFPVSPCGHRPPSCPRPRVLGSLVGPDGLPARALWLPGEVPAPEARTTLSPHVPGVGGHLYCRGHGQTLLTPGCSITTGPPSPGTLTTPASSPQKAIHSLCLSLSCPHEVGQLARGHLAMAHGFKGGSWHKTGQTPRCSG